jgi:hypothetical protein
MMMSVSFLAQGTGRKLITGFLLFVFTVSSVMPGYAAGDHLRPPAVKNRKLYSTLQQNLGAMLDGGVLSVRISCISRLISARTRYWVFRRGGTGCSGCAPDAGVPVYSGTFGKSRRAIHESGIFKALQNLS